MLRLFPPLATVAAALSISALACAAEPVDYLRQVKPILHERCFACHAALKQEAGLRLDTAALAAKGGDSGASFTSGKAGESLLIGRISSTDPAERMPAEGEPLTAEQIVLIKTWIDQGALAPADEQPEVDPREHWAFKKPARPTVPQVSDPNWQANPIDAFIAAERARRGLSHQPAADRRVWLRRVYLDLIGLPPTPIELSAFVADSSPAAHEAVVTRLLDSPQYGERWGRHWMDIWRYSDWWGLGAEVRNSQKHIWHWRDWIIESLNADKPYDQMLREMLAADELYPNDLDRLRATGFLARQYFKFNRTSWLDETIEHTTKAMLGLTFNCAKCHDHKYDPIAQTDYYRLRAVFEPYQVRTDQLPGHVDFERDGLPRAFDCNLDAPTYLHVRGDDRNPDKSKLLEPGVPTFLAGDSWMIEPVQLPTEAYQPALRAFVVDNHLKAAEERIATAQQALDTAQKKIDELKAQPSTATTSTDVAQAQVTLTIAQKSLAAAQAEPPAIRARAAATQARHQQPAPANATELAREAIRVDRIAAAAKAEVTTLQAEQELARAAADKKAEVEQKLAAAKSALDAARKAVDTPGENFSPLAGSLKTLESNLETEESRQKPFPATSTGRRTALAKWLTDPENPLPARVAVNHIWMRHFGRPLVPTVFDFGRKGTPPTHPQLLDWLAVELVGHNWSMKHIHRLIVTSQAYRMSSSAAGASSETISRDPESNYYWRANPVRMEAQSVRDSLLQLAGELDTTMYGPPIPAADEASRRRSLYFFHSHNDYHKFLSMFDDANVLDCYRRAESIVPQQALALENSPFVSSTAEKIAQRISATLPAATPEAFVREAFLTVLAAQPSEAEMKLAVDGLARLTESARGQNRANPENSARTNLVHALLNHNDFVTIR